MLTLSSSFTTTAVEGSSSSSNSATSTMTAVEGSCPFGRDLSPAIASHRFFPASPSLLNSIVDSTVVAVSVLGAGVAMPTYSPNLYWEFRRSMEEVLWIMKSTNRSRRPNTEPSDHFRVVQAANKTSFNLCFCLHSVLKDNHLTPDPPL
ncbi:hypothetical protein COCNU_04G013480 [Cocos nucifera]|uniref:Uncharacterized protein n=1 Tax=Cocos nucifera TaxID=13894 RepID=A0A8K0I7E4_COCNU|nr:hypothetical protein COCNU_04G013480 [Cocos nucifera]